MTITLAGVRQTIAARVELLSGWSEAPVAWDAFSWTGVPEAMPSTTAHRSFAIGITDTRAVGERHRSHFMARSTIVVRSLHRLSPAATGPVASVDAALAAELLLIKQLDTRWVAAGAAVELTSYFARSRRTTAPSGEWILIEDEFAVDHIVDL